MNKSEISKICRIVLSVVCLVSIFYSCDFSSPCPPFEYSKFNIDTNRLNEPLVFIHSRDSLLFYAEEFHSVNQYISRPSFMSADECYNGYGVSYECKKVGAVYKVAFGRRSSGYAFSVYFPGYCADNNKYFDGLSKKDAEYLIVEGPADFFMQDLRFKDGQLKSFIDINGKRWVEL